MTRTDILDELDKLPADEQLSIVEKALHKLREQFRTGQPGAPADRHERLSIAADALKDTYASDSELTAFATLDHERDVDKP